jgi:hypothetical protein
MKKNSSPAIPEKTEEKSAFYHAGEIIGSIGFHIVDGKDKVIGAIKSKLGKKKKPESKAKKASKKNVTGKAGRKKTETVRKSGKKVQPAKSVRKKTDKVK